MQCGLDRKVIRQDDRKSSTCQLLRRHSYQRYLQIIALERYKDTGFDTFENLNPLASLQVRQEAAVPFWVVDKLAEDLRSVQ